MKILLVAINAKYIHSNPAVYSLQAYAAKFKEQIAVREFTINNSTEEILQEIFREQADLVAFSCYIWNIRMVKELITELRLVQPEVKLWLGGPEVSYHSDKLLASMRAVDGIVIGEGEQTFHELLKYYLDDLTSLNQIRGIVFRDSAKRIIDNIISLKEDFIIETPCREPLSLEDIPFLYEDIDLPEKRIIYYESSRGCPYSCSYCLSSVEKSLRLKSIDSVKKELKYFLKNNIAQVKFVDRTFNCNRRHAMEIWHFIKDNDNGITNFHFEITADLLSDEEVKLLATLRPGQVQLEIGVQTTNPKTMEAINRKVDFQKLSKRVEQLRGAHNIHLHLDLIAGLPLENMESFRKSFDEVYKLKPDQLQLGFLKVLKGSPMEEDSKSYGIVYRDTPPYEVLYTADLSFRELTLLKGVCDMVEVYYNSGQFTHTIKYLEHYFQSAMELYMAFALFYWKKGYYSIAHTRLRRYEIIIEFYKEVIVARDPEHKVLSEAPIEIELLQEIIVLDLYLRENLKSRPNYARPQIEWSRYNELKKQFNLGKEDFHVEEFSYKVLESAAAGVPIEGKAEYLFRYSKRDPIDYSAEVVEIT